MRICGGKKLYWEDLKQPALSVSYLDVKSENEINSIQDKTDLCFSLQIITWPLSVGLLAWLSAQRTTRETRPPTQRELIPCLSTALPCSLTLHIPLSRTVIIHQRRTVCFSLFLSACPRLMIQISGVHPDLCRTSPLIQPFSSCHHLVNWSFPDVSSWHVTQMVTCGCGIPGLRRLFASWWRINGNNCFDF